MIDPTAPSRGSARVVDFMQQRLERALRHRVRYRYVKPRVVREGEAFRIQSPCCSRNVDPAGGVIDIALLSPATLRRVPGQPVRAADCWRLYARDHATGTWTPKHESAHIDDLMDVLCVDAQRIYWP